jgi:hypothetical protein
MSTESWSSRVRHDSDATYQEWRDELITKLGLLVTAGVLAADETNITPGVGARPGTNTEQGYAVYHLADSLHATAPIDVRFGFGTSTGATAPRLQATVGTSTNGSGVLGGTALSTTANLNGSAAQTADTARQSYLSCVEGFLGLNWKEGASNSEAGFFVCRTCDSAGDITAIGAMAHWGGQTATVTQRQALRFAAPAAAFTAQTTALLAALGMSPQAPVNTTVDGDIQIALGWTITPAVSPLFAVCGVYAGEVGTGNTFSVVLVGSTPRTFLVTGSSHGAFGPITGGTGTQRIAMLWE